MQGREQLFGLKSPSRVRANRHQMQPMTVKPDRLGVPKVSLPSEADSSPTASWTVLGIESGNMSSFFSPSRPDILRAVTASRALRLLQTDTSGDATYRRSVCVESIGYFWSHSWHASARWKILSLCLFHNFWPSFVCGGIAAALCSVALLLPWPWALEAEAAAILVILSGLCVSSVTLTWWPSQDSVFLDKACISQDNPSLKRQGILSLGFMLKRSRTMLVLWDATYFQRLWCVVEMAARLKLQEETPEVGNITVLPGPFGPFMLTTQAAITAFNVAYYVSVMASGAGAPETLESALNDAARIVVVLFVVALGVGCAVSSQLSQIVKQVHQLEVFSIKDAECFCCKENHVHPDTGGPIPCDRVLVEHAVANWFGSIEAFDSFARSALKPFAVKSLILPYRYVVLACMPSLWGYLGQGACFAKAGRGLDTLRSFRLGMFGAFLFNPVGVYILIAVWHVSASRTALGMVMKAMVGAILLGCLFFAVRASEITLGAWGGLVNASCFCALAALLYCRNKCSLQ